MVFNCICCIITLQLVSHPVLTMYKYGNSLREKKINKNKCNAHNSAPHKISCLYFSSAVSREYFFPSGTLCFCYAKTIAFLCKRFSSLNFFFHLKLPNFLLIMRYFMIKVHNRHANMFFMVKVNGNYGFVAIIVALLQCRYSAV